MMSVGRLPERVPEIQVVWDEWVQEILEYLNERVRVVIDLREDA